MMFLMASLNVETGIKYRSDGPYQKKVEPDDYMKSIEAMRSRYPPPGEGPPVRNRPQPAPENQPLIGRSFAVYLESQRPQ
jgi:hypothetical protein